MTLQELMDAQLPLCRKERFYTGTVFPALVAKDNFKHLPLLLTRLGIFCPEIFVSAECTNIQFFTEYSLLESFSNSGAEQVKRRDSFQQNGLSTTKDTPDIIILIETAQTPKRKILIALEAKMYSVPRADELERQMLAQEKILDCIKKTLNVDEVYHIALLPEKLIDTMDIIVGELLTWEEVLAVYEPVAKNDYFWGVLKLALDSYDDLKSNYLSPSGESTYGKNNEGYLVGWEIYQGFKNKTLDKFVMGRNYGINGRLLSKDLQNDGWKSQKYETRKTGIPNKNWFSIEEFVNKVDKTFSH